MQHAWQLYEETSFFTRYRPAEEKTEYENLKTEENNSHLDLAEGIIRLVDTSQLTGEELASLKSRFSPKAQFFPKRTDLNNEAYNIIRDEENIRLDRLG